MATEKLLSMKLVRISMKTSALLNTIFESMFTYSGFIQMLLSKKYGIHLLLEFSHGKILGRV